MRRRCPLAARALPIALAGLALLVAPVASFAAGEGEERSPPIYKWVDENGIAHYTTELERVPDALRDRVEPLRDRGRDAGESGAESPPSGEESWAVRDRRPESAPDPWASEPDPYADPLQPKQEGGEGAEAAAASAEAEGAEPSAASREAEPAAAAAPGPAERAERRAAIERRIEALRAELAESEAQLKDLISAPSAGDEPAGFAESSELRSEAQNVARLVKDLAALEEKRAELGAPEPAESP